MATQSAGSVVLDLRANTKQFEQDANASANRVQGAFSGISAKIGKMFAVGALVGFSKSCIDVASALTEVQNVVDVSFPTMSRQMDEWAKGAASSFGMSELLAKRFAGRLGSMAKATGFAEAEAYQMSTAITQLAGDVASFYDLSHEETYEKLTAIFTGATRPLMDLGVVMNNATLNEYAMAQGMGKTVEQMSAAEKASLRYQYVMSSLSHMSGDFARTSGSWANQVRLLQLQFESLKATMGQSMIAVLLPVVKALNAIIQAAIMAANAFNRVIEAVTGKSMAELTGGAQAAGVAVGGLGGMASDAADSTDGLADAQGNAAKAAKAQEKAQKDLNRTLAGFDRINKLTANADNMGAGSVGGGGGSVGGAGGAVSALGEVQGAADGLQEALDRLELPENLRKALDRLKGSAGELADTIKGGLKWAYDNVLVPLGQWTIDELLPDIINGLADAFGHLNDFLKKVGGPLERIIGLVGDALKKAYDTGIKPFADWLVNLAAPAALDAIASAFDLLATAAEKLSPVASALYDDIIKPLASAAGSTAVDILEGISGALSDAADYLGRLDFTPVSDAISGWGSLMEEGMGVLGDIASDVGDAWAQHVQPVLDDILGKIEEQNKKLAEQKRLLNETEVEWEDENGLKHRDRFNPETQKWETESQISVGQWGPTIESDKSINPVRDRQNVLELLQEWFRSSIPGYAIGEQLGQIEGFKLPIEIFATDNTEEGAVKARSTLQKFAPPEWISKLLGKDEAEPGVKKASETLGKYPSKKEAALGYKYTGTAAEWTKSWAERVTGAFYPVTGDRARPLGYRYTNTQGEWKKQWQSRVTSSFYAATGDRARPISYRYTNTQGEWKNQWKNRVTGSFYAVTGTNARPVSYDYTNTAVSWKEQWTKRVNSAFPQATRPVTYNYTNTAKAWKDQWTKRVSDSFYEATAWVKAQVYVPKYNNKVRLNPVSEGQWSLEAYAKGGFLERNTPRLAVVGDNTRQGEYILPESSLDNALGRAAAKGGNAEVLVPLLQDILYELRAQDTSVYLDGAAITRNVVRNINQQVQSTGRSPLLV